MEKTYDPKDIEQRWYSIWEEKGYFKPTGKGPAYSIFLPPPNVTGNLHMGHGFQHTLMDALVRYHRMLGDNVHWQVGTDHAGIATQMVVERQLLQQGTTRHALGRESFVEKVWEWKHESGGNICRQMRRLGVSADWSRERFTMEPELSAAVIEVFVRLYDEGLIYRGQRLVNWDPTLQTAISDLEVISEEVDAHLWHIRYPFTDGSGYLVVATTRPETLFGDAAVAVNPVDERYQHLIGKQLTLPLTARTIPIIADDYVDSSFGSGCVKITPAHDFNDYAVGQRHQLPLLNILTPTAMLNDHVPEAYRGLDRFAARKKAIAELTEQGLLEKIEPHRCTIPRGDRSDDIIEPYLTDQWFVSIKPLAEPAIKAVEEGQIRFVPENWSRNYFQWMNNIEDWCISRQLWWGHRVPAWYDSEKNIYVGRSLEEVRKKYQLSDSVVLTQETDVLDTWFSAALWPFSTLGWPSQTAELKTWYPSSVLVTGFDIIFFWVARMIMMGLKFADDVPFKDVFITGLIRDAHGQKMSKTKGNVLDPLDLVDGITLEELVKKRTQGLMQPEMASKIAKTTRQDFPEGIQAFGMDALRFTFCALSTNGRDIRFDFGRLEGYRNFCNKLWNATRFVLMNTEGYDVNAHCRKKYSLCDRWIFSQLQSTLQKAHECFAQYRFDLLAQTLYEFTWNEYCDWYLELAKITINQGTAEEKQAAQYTLLSALESLLRLMHPLMPYITEEIWQKVSGLAGVTGDTISLQAYPMVDVTWIDEDIELEVEWMKKVVLGLRNIRGEMGISPAKSVKALFRKGDHEAHARIKRWGHYIQGLAKLESITWLNETDVIPPASTSLVGDLEILIPLAGSIDLSAELVRLNKELEKTQKESTRIQAKLNNPSFVEKAPPDVVKKETNALGELAALSLALEEKIKSVQQLMLS